MWTEQFASMLMLIVMSALLRASYKLTRPTPHNPGIGMAPNTEGLTLQQREWADKAAKRYAESQEKKWRRWNEVMFEPVK